jgi:hypothetical protein
MAELCADQDQIHKAGVFFALVVDNARLKAAAERVGEDPDGLDTAEFYTMAVVDAALAGERMTVAAEQLGLGCCYIGALRNHPKEAAALLGLPKSCFGLFGLAIGWPSEDCSAAIKPRLDQSTVWHKETYNRELDLAGYHRRMSAFYESQGMKGAVNWSMRSGRRAGLKRVGTRIEVKPFLTDQELDLR